MDRFFFAAGSLFAFLAVALGAFAAHALKSRLSADMLAIFEVGVRYHMYHALALLAVAWAASRWPETSAGTAGWFFLAGIVYFFRQSLRPQPDRNALAGSHHSHRRRGLSDRLAYPRLGGMAVADC